VLLGHFPLPVRLDEALWQIPLKLAEQPFLYDLLGAGRLFVHMPPTARFLLPGNATAAVPAHQDVSYNKHLGAFCVVWVPLVAIDAACGGMAVYPRTQGRGELFAGDKVAPADGWIPGIDVAGLARVALCPLAPGDVVVMGNETGARVDAQPLGAHAPERRFPFLRRQLALVQTLPRPRRAPRRRAGRLT
jgi:hypothetical protein